jgi:phosphatidylethanolamine/phosphatidyl-N-methylethanolamine N-methyltransferase
MTAQGGGRSGTQALRERSRATERRPLDREAVRLAYRRYALVYDIIFGIPLVAGRRLAVAAVNARGPGRVLEVGVGTGLTLPLYRADSKIVGIDLSPEMLARARHRVEGRDLRQVEALFEMDGQRMEFADGSFDTVVALHVLSVAPEPQRLMQEMRRVCAAGGELLILNHFRSERAPWRWLERATAPLAAQLGFRPDLERKLLGSFADLTLIEERQVKRAAGATLLRLGKGG